MTSVQDLLLLLPGRQMFCEPITAGSILSPNPVQDDGRVVILLPSGTHTTRKYQQARDMLTGFDVEFRSAPCGFGCRCSAAVRLASTPHNLVLLRSREEKLLAAETELRNVRQGIAEMTS